jgi:hypothetical protein
MVVVDEEAPAPGAGAGTAPEMKPEAEFEGGARDAGELEGGGVAGGRAGVVVTVVGLGAESGQQMPTYS